MQEDNENALNNRGRSFYTGSRDDLERFGPSCTEARTRIYKIIQTQMLILGSIYSVSPLSLTVDLPFGQFGILKNTFISRTFSRIIREYNDEDQITIFGRMKMMFQVGQNVPTKVIKKIDRQQRIMLSIDPKDVNFKLTCRDIKKGLLLWAAVVSKTEKGYILDSGIQRTYIVLPFKNIHQRILAIGQPLWTAVEECTLAGSFTTVQASIIEETLDAAMEGDMSLNCLIPGMRFNITVNNVLTHGLRGTFMGNDEAYIQQLFLAKPFEHPLSYRNGQTIHARLLYVQPGTERCYFTMKTLPDVLKQEYKKGDIIQGAIMRYTTEAVYVKLPIELKGVVLNKSILEILPGKPNTIRVLRKKFRHCAFHKCKIVSFHTLENIYICEFL